MQPIDGRPKALKGLMRIREVGSGMEVVLRETVGAQNVLVAGCPLIVSITTGSMITASFKTEFW